MFFLTDKQALFAEVTADLEKKYVYLQLMEGKFGYFFFFCDQMFLFKQEYKLQPKTWLFKDNRESTKLTVTAKQW